MARKTNVEKVIRILREVEVLQGQGKTIAEACRKVGVADHTYYRWKKEYGRLDVDQANSPMVVPVTAPKPTLALTARKAISYPWVTLGAHSGRIEPCSFSP